MTDLSNRNFLFLQGPHGPYFHGLAKMLRAAGGHVWRVGFNAGDRAFWFGASGYIPKRGPFNRTTAKLQGLFASYAHLWRR